MGLDISLYQCANPQAHTAWEEQRELASEKEAPPGQNGNWDAYRAFMDRWEQEHPDPAEEISIEIASKVYPEHLFKIGYLRSSYNNGGIERILGNTTGKGLHWIFDTDGEEYVVHPDWGSCLTRAREARDAYDAYVKAHGALRVEAVAGNHFKPDHGATSDEEAMKMFLAQKARHAPGTPPGNYSCLDGHFWFADPLTILAAIPGTSFGERGVFLIYDDTSSSTWYLQALEIVAEMSEWVLGQPDPPTYYLHWSG